MPGKYLFEYAVIRVVPRVEREEFMNVGVILYCPAQGFLRVLYEVNDTRLQAFCKSIDCDDIRSHLNALDQICKGKKDGGAIESLPIASRFRWLTATRSTVIQASKVHSGFCTDPEETLQHLFVQQVC